MIGEIRRNQLPFVAASALLPYQPVKLNTGAVKREVLPVATVGDRPQGLVGAASVAAAEAVTVYGQGDVVEALAMASIGAGAELGFGSTNGALTLITGASGITKWAVGQSLEPAAAGEHFSLLINPRQVSNLI